MQDPAMVSPRRRRRRGNSMAFALAVVSILITVAAALAIVSTFNLNMASHEEQNLKALEVARAGINQFVYDVQNGSLDPPKLTLGLNFLFALSFFSGLGDPFLQPVVVNPKPAPYTMNGAQAHGLEGDCFITFKTDQTFFAASTSNINGTGPIPSAFDQRSIPAFSVDVIATGVVGNTQRRLRATVLRKWNFAVAAAHDIYITGDSNFPTQVQGDVYTLNGSIKLGEDPQGNLGTDCKVQGELATPLRFSGAIKVDPGNSDNGERLGSRVVQYPDINDVVVDNSYVDLSTFTSANPTPEGAFVYTDPTSPGDFFLDATTATPMVLPPGNPPSKSTNYVLNGNLKVRSNSQCTGLKLNNAVLKISSSGGQNGDLIFTDRPCTIFGEGSVLSVDGALKFSNGFIDGGSTGFVMKANSITTVTGGEFKGLIIVKEALSMQSLPGTPPSSLVLPANGSQPADLPVQTVTNTTVLNNSAILIDPLLLQSLSTVQLVNDKFPMKITGAILAPKPADGAVPPPLELKAISVKFDPTFLRVLNAGAPLSISAFEELP